MSTAERIQLALGGVGAAVPAITYFTNHAPPLFAGAGPLVSVLGLAMVYLLGWRESTRDSVAARSHARTWAIFLLIVSFLTLGGYGMVLAEFTLLDPSGVERFQIGFGAADWSLTSRGMALKERFTAGPAYWMTYEQWTGDAAWRIWKPWTVYTAGSILLVVYTLGFVCWCAGLGVLARLQKLSAG